MSTEAMQVKDASGRYLAKAAVQEVPPGYKRTEVGVIPEEWEAKPIRDIAPLQRGFDLTTSQLRAGPHPVVYSNGVLQHHEHAMAKGPGVVTGRSGTIGKVHFIERDYWPHNTALWVTSFRGNDPKFVYYLYIHIDFARFLSGSGVPTLNRNDVHQHIAACPPPPEQRAIADVLSDVDGLLGALEALIAKKRAIKQAAMQQLLSGKTRLPGFSGAWEAKRLGDISTIAMGRTPSRSNTAFWGRGHVWLSIADLHDKVVGESKEQITDLAATAMTPIPKGALLMSFKLSIGRLCFAGCDLFTNEAICSFTDLKANADYLYYALSRTDFSLYGKQAVKGYTLNSESLRVVEVAMPELSEQTAIATVLSDMDAEIAALERRRDKTRALKQGMLQQLLTGRIRLI